MCVGRIVTILTTGINSVQDIRKKEIFLIPTSISFAVGIIYSLLAGISVSIVLSSMLPGFMVLAISLMFKGQVGLGDAAVVLSVGIWNGLFFTFFILLLALAAASAVCVIFFVRGIKNRELPFVPFLLAGCIFGYLL